MYIVVVNSALTRFNQRRMVLNTSTVSVDTGEVFAREYVVSVAFNRQHVVVDHGLPNPSTSFFLTKLLHLAVPTFVINDGKII
jgi:hypothetical protein